MAQWPFDADHLGHRAIAPRIAPSLLSTLASLRVFPTLTSLRPFSASTPLRAFSALGRLRIAGMSATR